MSEASAALDALWAELCSKRRRLFSRRWLDELQLRAYFDLDLMAPHKVVNAIPEGTIPDCARCEDICCAGIENVVSLRLSDIARLIDIGRTELISRKKPRFADAMLRRRPFLAELIASDLWRTLPVLKQVGEMRVCAALTPDIRCGLYPDWPLSCERFPYSLLAARRRVVWGTRCPEKQRDVEFAPRREEMFEAAVSTYNERIKDAVLLAHARDQLGAIGVGAFLVEPDEDPFEPAASSRLPVL